MNLKKLIPGIFPPAARFRLRELLARLNELGGLLHVWQWRVVKLTSQNEPQTGFCFIGRKSQQALAASLLGMETPCQGDIPEKHENHVLVSELPLPGGLCIPHYLSTVLPLSQDTEKILAGYEKSKRKLIRKNRPAYRVCQVSDIREMERLDKNMLRPFAAARHGKDVVHLKHEDIIKMASGNGIMNLVYRGNEEIACHIGCEFIRKKIRYWRGVRAGYPHHIFTDGQTLREVNLMNTWLEMEWAIKYGYTRYDIGISLASPENGVIQWKRSLRGSLDLMGNHGYFYVLMPRKIMAKLLWIKPLFAVESRKITLHLGLPASINKSDMENRYREMAFGGLSKIYLHCETRPADEITGFFSALYAHQEHPPSIEISLIDGKVADRNVSTQA